jgi:hypothetical protein
MIAGQRLFFLFDFAVDSDPWVDLAVGPLAFFQRELPTPILSQLTALQASKFFPCGILYLEAKMTSTPWGGKLLVNAPRGAASPSFSVACIPQSSTTRIFLLLFSIIGL